MDTKHEGLEDVLPFLRYVYFGVFGHELMVNWWWFGFLGSLKMKGIDT